MDIILGLDGVARDILSAEGRPRDDLEMPYADTEDANSKSNRRRKGPNNA